jgi:hypothetical protein
VLVLLLLFLLLLLPSTFLLPLKMFADVSIRCTICQERRCSLMRRAEPLILLEQVLPIPSNPSIVVSCNKRLLRLIP